MQYLLPVCMCVFMSFHLKGFSCLELCQRHALGCRSVMHGGLRCNASSNFLHLRFWIYHILPSKTKLRHTVSQPNLVMDTGVHSLLQANCHQKVYTKFNLKVPYPHPMKERFAIFKKLISILLEGRLTILTGKGFSQSWY